MSSAVRERSQLTLLGDACSHRKHAPIQLQHAAVTAEVLCILSAVYITAPGLEYKQFNHYTTVLLGRL